VPADPVQFTRIDVTSVTPRTSPPYGTITHVERNSRHVLRAENGKMLIGPLGVNYFEDGPADNWVVYLRRWDVPGVRDKVAIRSRLPQD
jgi:hypothetical protein